MAELAVTELSKDLRELLPVLRQQKASKTLVWSSALVTVSPGCTASRKLATAKCSRSIHKAGVVEAFALNLNGRRNRCRYLRRRQ